MQNSHLLHSFLETVVTFKNHDKHYNTKYQPLKNPDS